MMDRPAIDRSESNRLLATDCETIAALIEPAALTAPVNYCDGWPLGEVVRHLGEVHRFVTHVVRSGGPDDAPEEESPTDDALASWFAQGAAALLETLDAADLDADCWTFGFRPGKAWFWVRRMAIETVIHRFDVEHALGATTPIPLDLAIAGLEEVSDVFFDRQVALDRTPPLPTPIALAASDAGTYLLGGTGPPGATISGSAADLLLSVWRRPHGPIQRTGDPTVLAAYDSAALVP